MAVTINHIASSSKGNAHLVSDGETSLLLDCGVPVGRLRKALNFKLSSVAGCLIGHAHNDHIAAAKDLVAAGIDCYLSAEAAAGYAFNLTGNRVHIVNSGQQFEIGTWKIISFACEHDLPCLGYYLASGTERVLYATDTAFLRPRFQGLTHLMVEVNYDLESINRSVAEGRITMSQKKRVMETHFGLDNLLEFLRVTDLSTLKSVHLMHLSNDNSDENLIRASVAEMLPPGVGLVVCDE